MMMMILIPYEIHLSAARLNRPKFGATNRPCGAKNLIFGL